MRQSDWLRNTGEIPMSEMNRDELLKAEAVGAEQGWVSPLTQEDKEYFAYLRKVFKRYNIVLSKATCLEDDFVTRVAESEFYLQQVNAWPTTGKILVETTERIGRIYLWFRRKERQTGPKGSNGILDRTSGPWGRGFKSRHSDHDKLTNFWA